MTKRKPSVLVLGTYHMGDRGNQDIYKHNMSDVKAEKQQKEIKEVIECIKAFNPTKIAVEFETIRADILDAQYKHYIRNEIENELERDEIHQFGFRLAKKLGHEKIYPVDWNRPVGGVPLGYVYDFLKDSDQPLYDQVVEEGEKNNKKVQSLINTKSIREVLVYLNNPHNIKKQQAMYMKFALAAFEDFYVGIDWLTNYWYRRNLIIFTNIKRLVQKSDERILVIYGAGHKYLLDNFFNESAMFHVHAVSEYL
ncbi:DUF5694 domain-containing protein [Terribacillus saccharophilus]|uniref:Haem-binding uptake Tiki superfamily ChaN domain-containing protein n=1 Tax=Terribacillus saccharophilus TaxID=361277 RepID=A0ABX4GZ16_9BACI|nr:DUF5694 domain-containing protein [Terribacillus saccharophilus]PAD35494.1 hypothetical protein CHH56_08510 [Terribacillus saccharophilus]PAD96545.1 hypothetical protein CHH50_08050 [Terribacillus saccharophilus]PAE00121.1 hypothetical protein CHH48_08955 [Terribacillus saccharophilus]